MVWVILSCLADGDSIDDILTAYPNLTLEDVYAALAYAAEMAIECNEIRAMDPENPLNLQPDFHKIRWVEQPEWKWRTKSELCLVRKDRTGKILWQVEVTKRW